MLIGEFMHARVITAHPDMSILDAQKVIHEKNIRRLPVIQGGTLVGLLTEGKLKQSLAPYTSYSISAWEFNWVLSRMKVKDVMQTKLITFNPSMPVEDVLALSQKYGIGTILVVDNGILVGICTTTEVSNVLIRAMGLNKDGTSLRISGHFNDDHIVKAIEIIRSHKIHINSLFTITEPKNAKEKIVIHLDAPDVTAIVNQLTLQGYEVESTGKAQDEVGMLSTNQPRLG